MAEKIANDTAPAHDTVRASDKDAAGEAPENDVFDDADDLAEDDADYGDGEDAEYGEEEEEDGEDFVIAFTPDPGLARVIARRERNHAREDAQTRH